MVLTENDWLTVSLTITLSFLPSLNMNHNHNYEAILSCAQRATVESEMRNWDVALAVIPAGSVGAICLCDVRISSVSAWMGASTLIYS